MSEPSEELLAQYASALKDYLFGGGEGALQRAYELGRSALAGGLGVLEMAAIHRQALVRILSAGERDRAGTIAAGQFFAESLSPFEMTHRGYREAHEALQASEKRYRELVENANDIVYTCDLDGYFTSVNRAGEELSGYQFDEMSKMHFAQVVPPEYLPLTRRMLTRKLSGEAERTRYELEIITRDGRRVPLEVHTALIYDNGRPVGVHGIARDITERKQAEQALRQLNERLEEEAKRIAHALHDEAGQLLSSVHLALDEFARDLPVKTRARLRPVKELLDQMEDELRRLSHELRPTILDDLGLLPALEFLADRVAKRSGLVITVQGPPEGRLAPLAETVLYRSVQEALTNVVRHAQAKQVQVEIRREEGTIQCSVRDDGVGFDLPAIQARRGERGLGLIGIRERAAALGGTFAIRSAAGEGTEVLITIPMESEDVATNSPGR